MKKTATIKTVRPTEYAQQARQVFLAFRGRTYLNRQEQRDAKLQGYKKHFEIMGDKK